MPHVQHRILRLPQVKDMVGLGKSAIYKRIKERDFPQPIKMGSASGWIQNDIEEWISQQAARRQDR